MIESLTVEPLEPSFSVGILIKSQGLDIKFLIAS